MKLGNVSTSIKTSVIWSVDFLTHFGFFGFLVGANALAFPGYGNNNFWRMQQQQQQQQWQELSRARARQWPWICCCCYNLPLTTWPTHQPFTSRCAFSALLSFRGCRFHNRCIFSIQLPDTRSKYQKEAKGKIINFPMAQWYLPNYICDV